MKRRLGSGEKPQPRSVPVAHGPKHSQLAGNSFHKKHLTYFVPPNREE
jgi:hypothetical protein